MRLPVFPRMPSDKAQQDRKLVDLFAAVSKQVNALSEGSISAHYSALTSAPTTGSWVPGDFIRNSSPTEQGTAGSKYVVIGWVRLTAGSANVLNTDWVAARVLTGN